MKIELLINLPSSFSLIGSGRLRNTPGGVSFIIRNEPLSPYANEVTPGGPLGSFRIGTGHQRTNHGTGGLEFSGPLISLLGKEKSWRLSITNCQWFNQSCLQNGTSRKPPKPLGWGASGLVNTFRCREGDVPRGRGALCPPPTISCRVHRFHLALPELHPL